MSEELKDQRVTIMLTPSEFKAVEDWSFANRIRSRGEAIRQLIAIGLRSDKTLHDLLENMDAVVDGERLHKGKLENKLRFVLNDNTDVT